jgi:hypothetical protein
MPTNLQHPEKLRPQQRRESPNGDRLAGKALFKTANRLNSLALGKSNAGKMQQKQKPAHSTQYCAPLNSIRTHKHQPNSALRSFHAIFAIIV